VIALGGISAATLPLLAPYSFGGAAVLGAVWQNFDLNKFRELVKGIGR
jgi:thiamine-phosphate pyrophosphorylase